MIDLKELEKSCMMADLIPSEAVLKLIVMVNELKDKIERINNKASKQLDAIGDERDALAAKCAEYEKALNIYDSHDPKLAKIMKLAREALRKGRAG